MQSILVVDDSPINTHVLLGALGNEYDVRVATNGKSGLSLLTGDQQKPDLILLDVMMPEMDGYEVCKALKANEETAHIPVIFVTAKSETADEEYGLSLGAADYIAKPFDIPIVRARIRNHLLLKAQREELVRQKNELQDALEQIKILRGFLPICCSCKKIRDDKGYWRQIESYISEHSEATFSHGICPECEKKLYPELSREKNEQA